MEAANGSPIPAFLLKRLHAVSRRTEFPFLVRGVGARKKRVSRRAIRHTTNNKRADGERMIRSRLLRLCIPMRLPPIYLPGK